MPHSVFVFGNINDEKFTAIGTAEPGATATIRLQYSHVPADWSVLAYSDPLVLLLGYGGEGAPNMTTLAGGKFSTVSTIDFGRGLMLRKTATIDCHKGVGPQEPVRDPHQVCAMYDIVGGARTGGITKILPYEEHMHPHPDNPNEMLGLGLARWETGGGGKIEALVSTRYRFQRTQAAASDAPRRLLRGFEVDHSARAEPNVFQATYQTFIRPA